MNLTTEATDYVAMQSSAETRRAYARDLQKWFDYAGPLAVLSVTAELVNGFKADLEANLSPNSAARTWGTVKGFYRYLSARAGKYEPTPFDYLKAPKRPTGVTPKVPTDEDVEAVLSEARKEPRRHIVVALLLNGLRAGEVAAMKVEDVETHNVDGAAVIMLRVNGKGMKQRLVPANFEAINAIGRWASQREPGAQGMSEWLVHDFDGSPLSVRQVEHDVYKSAEHAGVEGMHPHALRHHYATRLVKAGASPMHVQRLLGHSNVSTTMVYVTLDVKDLVKAAALDPMDERRITEVKERLSA